MGMSAALNPIDLGSAQDRRELGQHFIENRGRDTFNLMALARTDINGAGLIAAYDTGCTSARIGQ